MNLTTATREDLLAYYRQQIEVATQSASTCTNNSDLEVWKRIAEEWQRLHDALQRDPALPPVLPPVPNLKP